MARILIVDDDQPTRRLVRLILSDPAYDLRFAGSAREALENIGTSPDLLVSDMLLPDQDGLSMLKEARQRGYAGPVLAMTAMSSNTPLVQDLEDELGALSVLLKPFDPDELVRRVAALLAHDGTSPV